MSNEFSKSEPPLRPKLDSPANLPEPGIRLAMARSRLEQERLPHSKLGKIALGAASLISVVAVAGVGWIDWEIRRSDINNLMDYFAQHGNFLGFAFLALFLGLGLSFVLGVISLFSRGTRKTTGLWAIGLGCGTAVLYGVFIAERVSSLSVR